MIYFREKKKYIKFRKKKEKKNCYPIYSIYIWYINLLSTSGCTEALEKNH